jgi:hypothetical protein
VGDQEGAKGTEHSPRMSRDLILGLLASCEPLHKLCQAHWEGSLDQTVGDPQAFSQPLKVIGVQRLVRRHVSRGRKRNCWGISLEQSLHRDTLISSTNVPVHAPMFLPLFRVS